MQLREVQALGRREAVVMNFQCTEQVQRYKVGQHDVSVMVATDFKCTEQVQRVTDSIKTAMPTAVTNFECTEQVQRIRSEVRNGEERSNKL